jgi:hypothetical protein
LRLPPCERSRFGALRWDNGDVTQASPDSGSHSVHLLDICRPIPFTSTPAFAFEWVLIGLHVDDFTLRRLQSVVGKLVNVLRIERGVVSASRSTTRCTGWTSSRDAARRGRSTMPAQMDPRGRSSRCERPKRKPAR